MLSTTVVTLCIVLGGGGATIIGATTNGGGYTGSFGDCTAEFPPNALVTGALGFSVGTGALAATQSSLRSSSAGKDTRRSTRPTAVGDGADTSDGDLPSKRRGCSGGLGEDRCLSSDRSNAGAGTG